MLGKIGQEWKQGRTLLQFGFLKATGQALGLAAPLVIGKSFADSVCSEAAEELFGSYTLAKMVVFLFATVLIASCQAPFIVFANQERGRTGKINKTFSVQLSFFILSFCIFCAVILPFNKYIARFAQIDCGDFVFLVLAFVGLALKSFSCNLLMGMGQRIKNSLAELVFGGTTLALVFMFYLTGYLSLRTAFLIYLVSGLLVALVFLKTVDFEQLRPLSIDKQVLKGMLGFTMWVMLGSTAVYLVNWGGPLVLRLFAPLGDIGTYGLGYQIFKGITILTFAVNAYFLPFVSQHIEESPKMRTYLYNKRPKIFLLGVIFIGLLFVFVPFIFQLFYGDVYQGSITVVRLLLVGSALLFYSVFYETLVLAVKRYKFTQIIYVVQALLSLSLSLLLVPFLGVLGPALAAVISYFFRAAAMEVYFRTKLKKLLGL
jgi:O-antigen/teichoic acid export membrane protein